MLQAPRVQAGTILLITLVTIAALPASAQIQKPGEAPSTANPLTSRNQGVPASSPAKPPARESRSSSARPPTPLKEIVFRVPIELKNIHADITHIAPMCRIFTGNVMSNANELGSGRPYIQVLPANRNMRKTVDIPISSIHPGKRIEDVTSYTCTLYITAGRNGPLQVYSPNSPNDANKSIGTPPVNVVSGSINPATRRSSTLSITTGTLKAQGIILGVPQNASFRVNGSRTVNYTAVVSGFPRRSAPRVRHIRYLGISFSTVPSAAAYRINYQKIAGPHRNRADHSATFGDLGSKELMINGNGLSAGNSTGAGLTESCEARIKRFRVQACMGTTGPLSQRCGAYSNWINVPQSPFPQ